MPSLLANVLSLLGALVTLYVLYAYLTRILQRRLYHLNLTPIGRHWFSPLVNAGRALVRVSSVQELGSRGMTAMACMATLLALVGTLMLWADMASPSCPWLLTQAIPGFGHDLLWHLLWYQASLLGVLLWGNQFPASRSCGVYGLFSQSIVSVPVSTVGVAGALWLLGTTNLAEMPMSRTGSLPVAMMQPLGLVVVALSLWLGGRRTLHQPGSPGSPWVDEFQWQHAGASNAWLHMCEFLQRVYAVGILIAVFGDGPRLWSSVSWGWFLLKTAVLLIAMYWVDARWLTRRYSRPMATLAMLACLGLGNLVLAAVILALRMAT